MQIFGPGQTAKRLKVVKNFTAKICFILNTTYTCIQNEILSSFIKESCYLEKRMFFNLNNKKLTNKIKRTIIKTLKH